MAMSEGQLAVATTLAGVIRRWREEAGLSQEELARVAGLKTGQTVYRIERGQRIATMETYEKVAAALGRGLTDLLASVAPSGTEGRLLEALLGGPPKAGRSTVRTAA